MDLWKLDSLNDDKCLSEFHLQKNHIYQKSLILKVSWHCTLPNSILCWWNWSHQPSSQMICLPLQVRCFAVCFGRAVLQISTVTNQAMDIIFCRFHHLLSSFNQPWPSPTNIQSYTDKVSNKGTALDNCWGFINGNVLPVCTPNQHLLLMATMRYTLWSFKVLLRQMVWSQTCSDQFKATSMTVAC